MITNQKTKIIILLSLFFLNLSFLSAQQVAIYKTNDLLNRIHNNSDTTYIVNFWATWCKPCVAELPEFEKFHLDTKNTTTKVLLVSLDFKEELDKKVKTFLQKNHYSCEIVLFDESNANEFINKIDSTWSGAIPATMITFKNKTYYHFIEKKVTYDYLQQKTKH